MPSNNTGKICMELAQEYPDKIAFLFNPTRKSTKGFNFIYAVDNGCFSGFNEKLFFNYLDYLKSYKKPMFVVSPDVVGCHDRTLALWYYYYPKLKTYNYSLAFVAQDGCEPELVPKEADWIFIGGNDPWKMENIHKFIGSRPVHVGRVNGIGRLKYCESLGVSSVDGTGWMRARNKQFHDLMEYFVGEKQIAMFA